MNAPQKTGGSFLARLSYLLPLLSGALLLIPAFVPHIFFYRGKSLSATIGLFDLLGYLRAGAANVLHASETVAPSIYRSALLASILTAVSWFLIVWYAIFAILSAVVGVWSACGVPSASLNTAKRVYRIVVPNRVFYGIFCFLPILPALMPYCYERFLSTTLSETVRVYFYGAPDWVFALIGGVLCAVPFFLSLRAQKEQKIDLFRIYRVQ